MRALIRGASQVKNIPKSKRDDGLWMFSGFKLLGCCFMGAKWIAFAFLSRN
jgi:hypothetical protein